MTDRHIAVKDGKSVEELLMELLKSNRQVLESNRQLHYKLNHVIDVVDAQAAVANATQLQQLSADAQGVLPSLLPAVFEARRSDAFLAIEIAGLFPKGHAIELAGHETKGKLIGCFLRRVKGVSVGGLMFEEAGEENGRKLWRVALSDTRSLGLRGFECF